MQSILFGLSLLCVTVPCYTMNSSSYDEESEEYSYADDETEEESEAEEEAPEDVEVKPLIIEHKVLDRSSFGSICNFLKLPAGKLAFAILNNRTKVVYRFKVGEVDTALDYGWGPATLLSVACVASKSKIINHVLKLGAQLLINQSSALCTALEHDNCEATQVLIKAGARVDQQWDQGKKPLHYAKSSKAALLLLDAGAKVDLLDQTGHNAMYYARDVSLIRLLWKSGSPVQVETGVWPSSAVSAIPINKILASGRSLLNSAVAGIGSLSRAALPLTHGADSTLRNAKGLSAYEQLLNDNGPAIISKAIKLRDNPFRSNRIMLVKKMFDQHCETSKKIGENTRYIAEGIVKILYEDDPFVSKTDQHDLERLGVIPKKNR